jgi:heme/copper-type cytochrome/quinol oxidase subunit 2
MMYDWSWYWMFPMMLLWLIVLGAVIYIAVRLGNRDSTQHPHHH